METTQAQIWDPRRGRAWADLQPLLDRLFAPFEGILTDAVATGGVRDVLDIGCGTGAVTLALLERLGAGGRCTGIDIDAALLSVARRRAAELGLDNAHFVLGDGQRHDFPHRAFDAAASRFGVMFFDDPERAFANIRTALRPGGVLACAVWRSAAENPFMTTADRAIAPILGSPAPSHPDAPGQFAFADADRVGRILRAAGWWDIDIGAIDVPCTLTAADLATYVRRMGRAGMSLPDLDEARRDAVGAALDAAFAPFVSGGIARFDAACWMVRARTG